MDAVYLILLPILLDVHELPGDTKSIFHPERNESEEKEGQEEGEEEGEEVVTKKEEKWKEEK